MDKFTTTALPETIRQEYGHRIKKALGEGAKYMSERFSIRERLDIAFALQKNGVPPDMDAFLSNVLKSLANDIFPEMHIVPVYKEKGTSDGIYLVRGVRVMGRKPNYVRMTQEKILQEGEKKIFIRQDDEDEENYVEIPRELL